MNVTCSEIASRVLGEPIKRQGSELLYLCTQHKDTRPSLQINVPKDCFLCGPCGKSGNSWRLSAFLAGLDPNDKKGVAGWLREHGFNGNGNGAHKNGRATKPAKEEFQRVAVFEYGPTMRHVRLEAPPTDGMKPNKKFVWESLNGSGWIAGLQGQTPPLYTNRLFRESDQLGLVLALEGEAKADLAGELGFPAFSFKGLTAAHCEVLTDLDLILWLDKDQPGAKQAHDAAVTLAESKQPRSIRLITPPPELPIAGDIVDAVKDFGYSREKILSLIEGAKPYPPEPEQVGIVLSGIKEEKVQWLWPGRIPRGALTILDGPPGISKSLTTTDLTARVTTGRPLPGSSIPTPPAGVIICSAEDSLAHVIVPRLRVAGADLSRVLALPYSPDHEGQPTFSRLPVDLPILEKAINRIGAVLVVLDVLVAYIPVQLSTKSDQDTRVALAPLAELADRTRVAVVAIRHLNKSTASDPINRGGGSIGIIACARSGLLLGADPQRAEVRVLASTKSNLGPPPQSLSFRVVTFDGVPLIEWLGHSEHSAASLLAPPVTGEDKSAFADAVEFLNEELNGPPVEALQVIAAAKHHGISEKTLRRAKESLGAVAQKTGAKWYWARKVAN